MNRSNVSNVHVEGEKSKGCQITIIAHRDSVDYACEFCRHKVQYIQKKNDKFSRCGEKYDLVNFVERVIFLIGKHYPP